VTTGERKTRRRFGALASRLTMALSFAVFGIGSVPQGFAQGSPVQKPSPIQEPQDVEEGEVISFRTTEVLLPVTVRDRMGKLVTTLGRADFHVFEDDREQPLSDLALREAPVDVVLMVDASSSVSRNLDDFRRAAMGFAEKLSPQDRISLIEFDDRIDLLQDWTRSRFQLRRSLERVTPGMFTRFHDALLLAAREQLKAGPVRHAVIVLTDGIDSQRGYATLAMALSALLEAQAIVYVISNTEIERQSKQAELNRLLAGTKSEQSFNTLRIGDLREGLRVIDDSESKLAQLAAATGGRLYKPGSFNALDSTYAEVADELRHQYTLYYTPLDKARDGRFRRVRVETNDSSLTVSNRLGYFAPSK
jgi:Ca-activated chloride channel homolog